jgi:selenocysteine lyase/cysteine desulfurase
MASNALGTVTDVAAVCRMAREAGALSFVDAVHAAAHLPLDVQAIGCDFLACSPYKFYGPHLGVLFGREALVAGLDVRSWSLRPTTRRNGWKPAPRIMRGSSARQRRWTSSRHWRRARRIAARHWSRR